VTPIAANPEALAAALVDDAPDPLPPAGPDETSCEDGPVYDLMLETVVRGSIRVGTLEPWRAPTMEVELTINASNAGQPRVCHLAATVDRRRLELDQECAPAELRALAEVLPALVRRAERAGALGPDREPQPVSRFAPGQPVVPACAA